MTQRHKTKMKMNCKHKLIYVLFFLMVFPLSICAQDPFSKLPSEQTGNQIHQMTDPAGRLPNRDWWSGSTNGEGPPTSGGGGGGAVGMSLMNGTVPLILAGFIYMSFLLIRRNNRKYINTQDRKHIIK